MFSKRTYIALTGALWLCVGVFLLSKGLGYLVLAAHLPTMPSLIAWSHTFTHHREQATLVWICLALFLGFLKGRMVLSKTVRRVTQRIAGLSPYPKFTEVYSRGYVVLIASMMCLGFLVKFLPIGVDIKGFVDVTVGSALINGAILYFRSALNFVTYGN